MSKLLKTLSKDEFMLTKAQSMFEDKRTELLRDSSSDDDVGVKKRDYKRIQKDGGKQKNSADYFR